MLTEHRANAEPALTMSRTLGAALTKTEPKNFFESYAYKEENNEADSLLKELEII